MSETLVPAQTAADLTTLVHGNNAFALDLYQALRGAAGNLACSPHSISLALAMTYAGARARTAVQMAQTLHFALPPARLHPAFATLGQELAARGRDARGKDGAGFRLNIANALWAQAGYDFLAPFLQTLADNYAAAPRQVDFAAAPEAARRAINAGVEEATEGRIAELLPPGALDTLTRLVLTNAIYFNAAWARPFHSERTAPGPFYLLDGREISVPLMQQVETLAYAAGADYQAVALPYDGRELEMLIILPAAGAFASFEAGLNAQGLAALAAGLIRRRVALTLPRFKVRSQFSLGETLAALGMPGAFSGAADFSGMEPRGELAISDVVHQALVEVDEAGTEAAAATAVTIATMAMLPAEPVVMTVDRPFLFLIRDVPTGAILFVGRVLAPGA